MQSTSVRPVLLVTTVLNSQCSLMRLRNLINSLVLLASFAQEELRPRILLLQEVKSAEKANTANKAPLKKKTVLLESTTLTQAKQSASRVLAATSALNQA